MKWYQYFHIFLFISLQFIMSIATYQLGWNPPAYRLRNNLCLSIQKSCFQSHGVNLIHIESRPSKQNKGDYDFFVGCDDTKGGLKEAIDDMKKHASHLHVLSRSIEGVETGE